ncbi:sensor histidine kinase [Methylobacterium dankookense]|uniref:Blue-light-activated histidine kinase n=1 Tax=Methylobacterium dankookense TaxID=560405 RepID=A0A564G827_9HYPH|nr:HWE histidine kinase domain-containing protein [Methylobacterium dankookense]GJD54638.1 Blue-light-activated histidine kinase [Methylobacterium dankookense]VUF15691.1 Blue-light-activated histidine kinase [Methylobacterium dankookense]
MDPGGPEALRLMVETLPQLIWRALPGGDWIWASRQWTAFTGQSAAQFEGQGWLAAVHPDDRARTALAWQGAEAGGRLEVEHRLRNAGDGAYRWFECRALPLRDTTGRVTEWCGTATDIHDLKSLQEQQIQMLFELQHRVRNTLAAVRVIARRSAETSESVETYAMHLDGRLDALSRVQSAVIRNPSAGISLAMLAADELAACCANEDRQVRIAGPLVLLRARAAERMGLALHELATNALKFGALAQPAGRIEIVWYVERVESAEYLVLDWTESGVPLVDLIPHRTGFGMDVLERMLVHDLKADTAVRFTREGLTCRIVLPVGAQIEPVV